MRLVFGGVCRVPVYTDQRMVVNRDQGDAGNCKMITQLSLGGAQIPTNESHVTTTECMHL